MKKKALVVGAALGVASSTEAANFNVTTNADDGAGSLRQAIVSANTNAGADTITFDASLTGSTITLTTGQMLISDSVDIQGPGSANLTVDANAASRVFYIYNPSPTPIDVTISGLTLENGFSVVPGDPGESAGGAMRVVGESLALDDVHVLDSIAGGDGGGIGFIAVETTSSYDLVPAVLSIENSVISGNTANHVDLGVPVDQGGCGGGVFVGAPLNVLLDNVTLANNGARCDGGGLFGVYFQEGAEITIQNSVITGNSAQLGSPGAGGGIAFVGYQYDSTVTIADTTISGNSGGGSGGGIATAFTLGLTVQRSTISGNTAEYAGGIGPVFSFMTLENSTVANNSASAYGGGIYSTYSYLTVKETTVSGNTAGDDGPGIYAYAGSQVDIVNSIVANNGAGPDLMDDTDSFFNVEYSLIEDQGAAQINDGGGNIFGQDPQLGALQNNGGPTETLEPAGTSPALDAGDPAFAPPPATDQRGLARVSGGRIDMGSVEDQVVLAEADLEITKVLEPGPVVQGGNLTFTLTVENNGPNAAPNVVVTDTLPPQLTLVSATPSIGTCDDGPVTITCTLGAMPALGEQTITIIATMTGSGPAVNTATVGPADNNNGNNTSQVTFTILPAEIASVPTLDPKLQLLLAAIIAAVAAGAIKRL